MNDRKTTSNVIGLTSNVELPQDLITRDFTSRDFEIGIKRAPESTTRQGRDPSKKSHKVKKCSGDNVFVSPAKVTRATGEIGSLNLNELLLVKRSPATVFQFDAREAADKREGQTTLPKISSFDMGSPARMYSDWENGDESNIGDPFVGILADTSDLTSSSVEGAAPTTPGGQVLKKPICSKAVLNKSFTMQMSGDSSPRKPRRAVSPKLRRRASVGSSPRHPDVPQMITCLPPDASPMKPSRQKSNDGLQRSLRKQSCPEMFSLRKALALVSLSDETSTLSDPQDIFAIITQDDSPTKPSRKNSNDALPTELISLQEALAMSLFDNEDEEFRIATAPIQASSRYLPQGESSLPPTKPTRKVSLGTAFD